MEWGEIKEKLYWDKIWKNKGETGTDCGRNNEKPEMDWEEVSENLNWDGWKEITEKLNWDKIWKGKGESELGWIGEK